MQDNLRNALILLAEVRLALNNGTKHYRKSDGKILETDEDIIKTLLDEGEIIIEPLNMLNVNER